MIGIRSKTMNTIKIGNYKVGLKAVYGEYNCGNKTVGRLELVVTEGASRTNLGWTVVKDQLEEVKIRDAIIENYLKDLDESSTFTTLMAGSPMFPNDSGTYRPGTLIYMDSVSYNYSYKWYNHWKALIALFETEPKFGVVVLKSPILPNRFYGTDRPSRIWTLVLPCIAKDICFDKKSTTPEMRASLAEYAEYVPEHWKKELKSLGVN